MWIVKEQCEESRGISLILIQAMRIKKTSGIWFVLAQTMRR